MNDEQLELILDRLECIESGMFELNKNLRGITACLMAIANKGTVVSLKNGYGVIDYYVK
jgi:hypothetical protein